MKSIKSNRLASFTVILTVYVLATFVGVITYRALDFSWWISLFIADATATVATFIFSLIFKNASVYDPYWSVQPPVILVAFSLGRKLTSLGILIIVAVSFWAIRLTLNWAYTFSNLNHQDWRYTMLSEKTGVFYPLINFVGIHMVPTIVVYACVLPAVYAIIEGISLNIFSTIFIAFSMGAVILQGIADLQMHSYRKKRETPFIRRGLWKHSRHPNYLGEILMWWGIGLSVAFAAPGALYLLCGAILNTALFLFVSIPLADGRQSSKAGFSLYKAETRMLLPIRKKSTKSVNYLQ